MRREVSLGLVDRRCVAAGITGRMSPDWAAERWLWKRAKKIDQMRSVFDDAMKTLALYEVDVDNRNLDDLSCATQNGRRR